MDKDYKLVREALIALMCVGDKIYYITYTDHIETWDIIMVEEDRITVDTGARYHPKHYFDSIEAYEGKLYILCNSLSILSKNKRVQSVIEIVEANERRIQTS
jgi:hypothetical protein